MKWGRGTKTRTYVWCTRSIALAFLTVQFSAKVWWVSSEAAAQPTTLRLPFWLRLVLDRLFCLGIYSIGLLMKGVLLVLGSSGANLSSVFLKKRPIITFFPPFFSFCPYIFSCDRYRGGAVPEQHGHSADVPRLMWAHLHCAGRRTLCLF